MSSPPLKAPPVVRWLSILIVVAAVIVRFWPHPAPDGAPAAATEAAAPATPASVTSPAPAVAPRGFGAAIGFRSRERLEEHFAKHGAEFHAGSAQEYLRLAQALRDQPAGGNVLERTREDGVVSRFDRASGAFIAFDQDGVIRTFFRPNDGERYFWRQTDRPHGAP